jgi:DNA-binding NarL/FixJ family response regulator
VLDEQRVQRPQPACEGVAAVGVGLCGPGARGTDRSRLTLSARGLTAREQDVANSVLQGASTVPIAAALHLSPHTVQDHLKAIFSKLSVNSGRDNARSTNPSVRQIA